MSWQHLPTSTMLTPTQSLSCWLINVLIFDVPWDSKVLTVIIFWMSVLTSNLAAVRMQVRYDVIGVLFLRDLYIKSAWSLGENYLYVDSLIKNRTVDLREESNTYLKIIWKQTNIFIGHLLLQWHKEGQMFISLVLNDFD